MFWISYYSCQISSHSVHFISLQFCKNMVKLIVIFKLYLTIYIYILSYVKIIDNMDMTLWIVGLRIRIFNFAIKLLTCILYIVRVMSDSVPSEWWVYRYFFLRCNISDDLLIFQNFFCRYVSTTTVILKCDIWITGTEVASYIKLIKYLYASNYYVMFLNY